MDYNNHKKVMEEVAQKLEGFARENYAKRITDTINLYTKLRSMGFNESEALKICEITQIKSELSYMGNALSEIDNTIGLIQ